MFKQFTHSSEPRIIGVSNGVYQIEINPKSLKKNDNYEEIKDLIMQNNVSDFLKSQKHIMELDIKILNGKILPKARITDILIFNPFYFGFPYIVSQKFVDCLWQLNVSNEEYKLFEIDLDLPKHTFYLLFIPMISNSEIVFPESLIFHKDDLASEEKKYFEINNYGEYLKSLEKDPFKSFDKITLDQKFRNKSIINIQGAGNLFFSDSLLEIIESNKISNFLIPNRQIELDFK